MDEVKIWELVLKRGLAQNQTLIPDPVTWSDDDFKIMETTLQSCLPLIRFLDCVLKTSFKSSSISKTFKTSAL
jgi:hypothetical protein